MTTDTADSLACPKCSGEIDEFEVQSLDGSTRPGFMCVPCDWTVIQDLGTTATPAEFIAMAHAAGSL